MNQPTRQAEAPADAGQVEISIKGSPAYLQRFFAAMARMAEEAAEPREPPTPILLTRSEACELLRCSPDTLSRRVKAGKLTNYGTGGKMLLSRTQLLAEED